MTVVQDGRTDVLHYPGDQTRFDPGHIMGPDLFGGQWRATGAVYDPVLDRTTLTLVPVPRSLIDRGKPA